MPISTVSWLFLISKRYQKIQSYSDSPCFPVHWEKREKENIEGKGK